MIVPLLREMRAENVAQHEQTRAVAWLGTGADVLGALCYARQIFVGTRLELIAIRISELKRSVGESAKRAVALRAVAKIEAKVGTCVELGKVPFNLPRVFIEWSDRSGLA